MIKNPYVDIIEQAFTQTNRWILNHLLIYLMMVICVALIIKLARRRRHPAE